MVDKLLRLLLRFIYRPILLTLLVVLTFICTPNLAKAQDGVVNGHSIFADEGRWASAFIDEESMAREARVIARARLNNTPMFIGHGTIGLTYPSDIDEQILSLRGRKTKILMSCSSGVSCRKKSLFSGTPTNYPSAAQQLSRQDPGVDYIGFNGTVKTYKTAPDITYRGMGGHATTLSGQIGVSVTRAGQDVGSDWIASRYRDGDFVVLG
jgi:hypothetical protein